MSTVFTEALAQPSLDECLEHIMDALGIDSGDVAGQHFGTRDMQRWAALEPFDRARLLRPWLLDELLRSADPVPPPGVPINEEDEE